jgi:hypothetical protein
MTKKKQPRPPADITVNCQGSIWLVEPHTIAAKRWLADSVQDDAQYWGAALVVEHRYLPELLSGLEEAGFTIERKVQP